MKLFAVTLLTAVSTLSFAANPTQGQRDTFAKTLASKYLDIALLSADARINQSLYCEDGTYTSEITQNTLKAISMARNTQDSAFAAKTLATIKSSKALQEVVSTQMSYRYALAVSTLGYTLAADKSALIGSVMYGPAMGALGNISEIKFGNATSAVITSKQMDDNGQVTYSKKYVTYTVSQNSDYQTIVTIDGTSFRLAQTSNGFSLVPAASTNDNDAYSNGFVENASECDA